MIVRELRENVKSAIERVESLPRRNKMSASSSNQNIEASKKLSYINTTPSEEQTVRKLSKVESIK